MLWATFLMALREIRRNAMRSVLTTLGVVIGVAAVIAMVTLGEGATARVTGEISGLGRNMLIVVPGSARRSAAISNAAPFDRDDVRAIATEVPGVRAAAPSASRPILAVYGNKNWSTIVTGSDNAFFDVRSWTFLAGRRFEEAELLSGAPVCVIGATVRKELFGATDPIGAAIRVRNVACEVVGHLDSKGRSTFGDDQDDFVVMPLVTFQRRIAGNDDVAAVFVSADDTVSTEEVQDRLEILMRQRRRIGPADEDDFLVRDMKEITRVLETATGVLTTLLGAIAAVSLLVGGIGIMNVMLVSVTERTREIGVRLAIGAREREVLLQFLVEAVVLSTLGGLLGIGLGLAGSYGAARALSLPFVFLPQIIVIAFVFSAIVGIAFGFFPARKAARLNPIDALRYE
ncbi:MAG: ABC transporter permease [Deltaproteobacteria bacterium]|nr:ABC transporter permease [Deltaproteobacteria bacterium]